MQKLFFLFFIAFTFSAQAQNVYYVAAKTGISLRETPNANAKVVEKINYAEKVIPLTDTSRSKAIITEGFSGHWWKVKYNNKEGYVVSNYLLSVPPPKAGTKTLKEYFAQLSAATGSPLVIKKTDESLNEMGESSLTKQFFKNGMEWHEAQGYETSSQVYILPGFSIEECFLLLRILNQYPDLIGEKDPFPTKKSVVTSAIGEKTVDVEHEMFDGKPGMTKKVTITSTQGAVTEFEIFLLNEQAVIYWTSGV
ncbi:SH3 domain-containing protein [Ferruginibacter sp. SUN106]|uniref:SH3 domain-containing protein n=1 Tax=Ferruginibacter sp. SUN106 TaxID=2978348 RepID=UPI003D368810